MNIEIIKHFQPEDEEFHGDYFTTVEVGVDDGVKTPFDLLATYRGSNTREAEAFAAGYAQALQTVGWSKHVNIIHTSANDADCETD
jgi:hypothetical protein